MRGMYTHRYELLCSVQHLGMLLIFQASKHARQPVFVWELALILSCFWMVYRIKAEIRRCDDDKHANKKYYRDYMQQSGDESVKSSQFLAAIFNKPFLASSMAAIASPNGRQTWIAKCKDHTFRTAKKISSFVIFPPFPRESAMETAPLVCKRKQDSIMP
jgi:hypothetical protein